MKKFLLTMLACMAVALVPVVALVGCKKETNKSTTPQEQQEQKEDVDPTPAPVVQYTITFVDADGTQLDEIKVNKGAAPAYTGAIPTKESTAEYTYTFVGWTPEIVAATEDATYTATYQQATRSYNITFQNYDGTELAVVPTPYGQIPVYNGNTPVKEDEDYTYEFTGWNTELVEVSGEATYIATFSNEGECKHRTYNDVNECVLCGHFDGVELTLDGKAENATLSNTSAKWFKVTVENGGYYEIVSTNHSATINYEVYVNNGSGLEEIKTGRLASSSERSYAAFQISADDERIIYFNLTLQNTDSANGQFSIKTHEHDEDRMADEGYEFTCYCGKFAGETLTLNTNSESFTVDAGMKRYYRVYLEDNHKYYVMKTNLDASDFNFDVCDNGQSFAIGFGSANATTHTDGDGWFYIEINPGMGVSGASFKICEQVD